MLNGSEVQRVREAFNLTQRQLAELTGLTVTTISAIETGNNPNPSLKTVLKIAEALQVPAQALFLSSDSSDALESSTAAPGSTQPAVGIQAPQQDTPRTVGEQASGATSK